MNQQQIEQGKQLIRSLYQPAPNSHKGQNGKVMVIGGSHLFHAASLWSLKVASRIVDMVFYSSVPENNEIVQKTKEVFHDGIVVPRSQIENYIDEADCVLIGPGMERAEIPNSKFQIPNKQVCFSQAQNKFQISNLQNLENIDDAGLQTYLLTEHLLKKYPQKKWVIDAGSLQMMEPEWIPENAIVTPHHKEFETLLLKIKNQKSPLRQGFAGQAKLKTTPLLRQLADSEGQAMQNLKLEEQVKLFAGEYNCVVLLKGKEDIIAAKDGFTTITGGNAGMTKGGTGDVLAGLVAGFYAKNEAFKSAVAASFLNKLAGERLFEKMGIMFNASDLTDEIPVVYEWCLSN